MAKQTFEPDGTKFTTYFYALMEMRGMHIFDLYILFSVSYHLWNGVGLDVLNRL